MLKRSLGRCEAFICVNDAPPYRCPNQATDIHHLLTKARGGDTLDRVGETYHLIHLCRDCHRAADGGEAYEYGMLIQGSVVWDKLLDKPVYTGPDNYLGLKYGAEQNAARHEARAISEPTT